MNTSMTRSLRLVGALVLSAAGVASLVASGGGGSGGSSVPYLAITSGNAFEVSSAVLKAIGLSLDLGEASGGPVTLQSDTSPAAAGFLLRRALRLPPRLRMQALSAQPMAAVGPVELPCDYLGTMTISGNVANPDALAVGDRITAVFDGCDDNLGYVLDGRLALVVRSLQGDPLTDVFLLGLDLTLTSLRVTEDNQVYSADGAFTLTLDNLDFPLTVLQLAGSRLTLTEGVEIYTLTGFDHRLEIDLGIIPEAIVAEVDGRFVSDVLGGKVDYVTTVPVRATGDNDPELGEFLITGDLNSTVRVNIVDSNSIRLDVDETGDGVVDAFVDTSWAELTGNVPP
ncbi:MAG: hypothetical protein OEW88_02730 [Gammaproteobacteria bacterium]|nr:hypothetical protein [Gammaproteobacteria bacterium]MDH5275314.1 hypothetical protein [Gammaproteobacteria bacterium]